MKKAGFKPDIRLYNVLLSVLAKVQPEKAEMYFNEISQKGIEMTLAICQH
jgi:pentatricopeptide repeat protein